MTAQAGFRLAGAGLSYARGAVALAGIDLTAAPGEQIALIGPSGAGKSSLLMLLAGALRPTSGGVELLGRSPWELSAAQLRDLRARIGMAWQAPPLPGRQRVVTAVLAGRLGQWPLWKSLASLAYPLDMDGAAAQLARFGVEDVLFSRCDQLSGGQLQRVGLARLLYQRPALMLADEPVSALDPTRAQQALTVLTDDARARGATLVASLHAVDLALACFPRIVGIKAGRVVFDLPAAKVDATLLRELYADESLDPPLAANERRFDAHAVGDTHAQGEVRLADI